MLEGRAEELVAAVVFGVVNPMRPILVLLLGEGQMRLAVIVLLHVPLRNHHWRLDHGLLVVWEPIRVTVDLLGATHHLGEAMRVITLMLIVFVLPTEVVSRFSRVALVLSLRPIVHRILLGDVLATIGVWLVLWPVLGLDLGELVEWSADVVLVEDLVELLLVGFGHLVRLGLV